MSPMACTVPRTVPVTFERPVAGPVDDADLVDTASPSVWARRTISSGHPDRRSTMSSPTSSRLRAARMGPRSRSDSDVRRRPRP